MIGMVLCVLALTACYLAGRASLGRGLAAVVAMGYIFGISRAHFEGMPSYFLFDCALIGLYLAQLGQPSLAYRTERGRKLCMWMAVLCIWPTILLFVPAQPFLVQAVGLRCAIFFLPCALLGARMTSKDFTELSVVIACLNLMALAVGLGEFFFGLERFMPMNAMTAIMYASSDVGESMAHRIPATFSSAHAFGGTMVASIPFLFGLLMGKNSRALYRLLAGLGLFAGCLGVFLSAARQHFIVLCVLTLVINFGMRIKWQHRFGIVALILVLAWVVSTNERLQRFSSLQKTEEVTDRVAFSMNDELSSLFFEYPMGNGLGGGGTNMPYFLADLVRNKVMMENEFARIMLEEGWIGLALWLGFVGWVFTRGPLKVDPQWAMARRLAWTLAFISNVTAFIGTGLLVAVPQSALLLMTMGWLAMGGPAPETEPENARHEGSSQRELSFVGAA